MQEIPKGKGDSHPRACMCSCSVSQSCLTLSTPWTVAHQVPLAMGFPRQECWSGLPCPSPGDLSSPGIQPVSPVSCTGDSLTLSHVGSPTSLPGSRCVFVLPAPLPDLIRIECLFPSWIPEKFSLSLKTRFPLILPDCPSPNSV